MTGLYQRLFTYHERQNRRPLEDFLTEALADLLNRLPEPVARSAAGRLLSTRPAAVCALDAAWPHGATAHWSTQRVIDGGRIIDLVLEVENRPLVIVENKIGAGFQEHWPDPLSECDRESQNQLATYGQWLARNVGADWGGAVVLLTHLTPAPPGFETDDQTYASRHRATVRWADLSRWLAGVVRSAEAPDAGWVMLADELVGFLKEQNMDSELATGQDLAALQVYVASADRVRNAIERVWEGSRSIWNPICQTHDKPVEITTEYGCVWKFRYLARADLRNCYLAAGIRFPDLSKYLSELAPGGSPYLFVELASEDKISTVKQLDMPDGWLSSQMQWLAKRPLSDLPTDPEPLFGEAETWVRDRIGEVVRALA